VAASRSELIIGTRGSKLALWQSEYIKAKLEEITGLPVSLKIIKTVSGGSFSGTFSVNVVCTGDGGTYNPSITYPTPGFVTINGVPTGNTCTVTEPTFPTPPAGYIWGTPVVTGSPASISKGTTNIT
jgi:hypothetical protein